MHVFICACIYSLFSTGGRHAVVPVKEEFCAPVARMGPVWVIVEGIGARKGGCELAAMFGLMWFGVDRFGSVWLDKVHWLELEPR